MYKCYRAYFRIVDMKLTHVQKWSNQKQCYEAIKLEDAIKQYPDKVSAKEGLFICALCGCNVTLTASHSKYLRHFRHARLTSLNLNDDYVNTYCKERYKYTSPELISPKSYSSHVLPMAVELKNDQLDILLGFFISERQLNELKNGTINIIDEQNNQRKYSINMRLKEGATTFLSCGAFPSQIYNLTYTNIPHQITELWPNTVDGFAPFGTLFYKSSSNSRYYKRLYWGAQTHIGTKNQPREFLLVIKATHNAYSLTLTNLNCTELKHGQWLAYTFIVNKIDQKSISLFKRFGVELVDKLCIPYQFWPPKISKNFQIINALNKRDETVPYTPIYLYHNTEQSNIGFYPQNNIAAKQQTSQGHFYKVNIFDKDQMIITGINGAIQFCYFRCSNISSLGESLPQVEIFTPTQQKLEHNCPTFNFDWSYLTVKSPYKGKIKIYQGKQLVDVLVLSAGSTTTLNGNNLSYQLRYEFYLGPHLVRTIKLIDPQIRLDELLCAILQLPEIHNDQGQLQPIVILARCKKLVQDLKRTQQQHDTNADTDLLQLLSAPMEDGHSKGQQLDKLLIELESMIKHLNTQEQAHEVPINLDQKFTSQQILTYLKEYHKTSLYLQEQSLKGYISYQALRALIYYVRS